MPFQPKKIKREHVLKALKEIDSGEIDVRASTKFDIIFEGKRYPPKDVMRLAHQYANGEYLWKNSGGEPTNKYLKELGFTVVNKNVEIVNKTVNVKQEFAEWLLKNAPASYSFYLGVSTNTIVERLNEISAFFPEQNFFKVDPSNLDRLIREIKFIFSTKERRKKPEFLTYDKHHSNGIPKAVMGKNNYVKFLYEKFKNKNNTKGEIFTWVPTHKELVKYLLSKENDQEELINILDLVGITPLNDQDPKGHTIKLQEIEPFSFFCYIYKYGDARRLENIQNIAKELNLTIPTDERGIPSAYAQKVWLFPYKYNRVNNEIKRLWQFFKDALNKSITDDKFADILKINNVGKVKISEGLFYIMPEDYFPINGPAKDFLKEKLKISPEFNSYSEYQNILRQIKEKTDKPFYELSFDAWNWNAKKASAPEQIINTPMESNKQLNKILFGPPGTGKTYNTINESLKILEPDYYNDNEYNREALNKRFKELLIKDFDNTKGQIAFCTFHQSFTYEDFVEGIKPKTNENKEVFYEIEDGIFKNICQLANSSISASKFQKESKLSWDEDQFKKASFYKLSLGEANNPDDRAIYEYCRDNSVIALGFGDDTNLTDLSESEIYKKCEELELGAGTAQRLSYFIHYLKQGSYVLVSNGNRYVRCLGKVTGDYEFVEDSPIAYHHFRKVEWIFVDENIPVEEIYDRNFSQKTIYKLDEDRLKSDFFVNKGQQANKETKSAKDYVLVIDEINRGNVSSIFGELITLIEPDKRAGGNEELEVILPYSKEPFKVPHNVYIVGTMNTADRSIEVLDTALRRRFAFIEKPPISKLILTEGDSGKVNGIADGINLKVLLDIINSRIEKLIDKDHKIGHSYFLKVNDNKSLINCFENEVIPLLEEYFFGDYGKIGLVLGDSFIEKINDDFEFASFEGYDSDVTTDLKERSVYKIKKSNYWNFRSI